FFETLGALPTAINLDHVHGALRTGAIEAQENALVVTEFNRFWEVQQYVSLTNHMWSGFNLLANLEAWRARPRDAQVVRERAVARAVELGVNYFDTAPLYGDGQSEQNLGAALKTLRVPVYVGTKVRLDAADMKDVRGAMGRSLDASLGRLGLPQVDLLQLHNNIVGERGTGPVSVGAVIGEVIPALQALQSQGKTRFWGITALGDTRALHR